MHRLICFTLNYTCVCVWGLKLALICRSIACSSCLATQLAFVRLFDLLQLALTSIQMLSPVLQLYNSFNHLYEASTQRRSVHRTADAMASHVPCQAALSFSSGRPAALLLDSTPCNCISGIVCHHHTYILTL